MFKIREIILGSIILFSSVSCQKGITPSEVSPEKFYDIVYMATHSRAPGASSWASVQGTFESRFSESQKDDGDGTFTMHYTTYLEPQFCPYNQNCVCSGGIEGKFSAQEESEPQSDRGYNPFDPYTPTGGSTGSESDPTQEIDPATGKPKVSKVYTFYFNIQIEKKSLSSGCKPEANRTIKIVRFSNGDLIMHNDYRELYMVPVVLPE